MGEHVSFSARGVHLVITDSVAPFAVGKYTGPLVEIFIRNEEEEEEEGAEGGVKGVKIKGYNDAVEDYFDVDGFPVMDFEMSRDVPVCVNFSKGFPEFDDFFGYRNVI